jgi:hypothetical protein
MNEEFGEFQLDCGVSIHGVPFDPPKASQKITAMMRAAQFGQVQVMEFLIRYYQSHQTNRTIKRKARIWPKTVVELIDKSNGNHTTPLMRDAQQGHISIVQLLVQHGANRNARNRFGMTPLMFAAQSGHADICRFLLEHNNADVLLCGERTNPTTTSSTALSLACRGGHVNAVKELVSAGCTLLDMNQKGHCPRQTMQLHLTLLHLTPEAQRPNPKQIRDHQLANAQRRMLHCEDIAEDDVKGKDDMDSDHWKFMPMETYREILFMLCPYTQIDLMQVAERRKRNFEIIRLHTLFQQNRADINITDGSRTYDMNTGKEWFKESKRSSSSDNNKNNSGSERVETIHPSECVPSYVASNVPSQDQLWLRTMLLLPAPLVRQISLFVPLSMS